MMKKRVFSLFLAVLMLATAFSVSAVPVVAAENDAVQDKKAYIDTSDFSIKGTNSVGNMLATEMENVAKNTQGTGNVIYSVEIDSNVAYAKLSTTVACTLFVGIYTEDMSKLLVNKYTEVGIDDKNVILEFEEELPQYFYIKAFLIGTDDFTPVSSVYANPMYTAEMQELLASTTEDYNADRVINFDDDITNNFAVLSEDVNIIDPDSDRNLLTHADIESDIYVFENIDSEISSLKSGDTLSYKNGDDYVIVKIGEISIDGTTASISGEETTLDEVFDYVKIDGSSGIREGSFDEDSCGEGVVFEGYDVPQQPKKMLKALSPQTSDTISTKFSWDFGEEGEESGGIKRPEWLTAKASCKGNVSLQLTLSTKSCLTIRYRYFEVKLDYSFTEEIAVSGAVGVKIPLGKLAFGIPSTEASVSLNLICELSGKASISCTLKGTVGYAWSSDVGGINLTSGPDGKPEIKADITFFVGLEIEGKVEALSVSEATLTAKAGVEVKASFKKDGSELSKSYVHDCQNCLKGEVYALVELEFKGNVLKIEKLSFSFKPVEWKEKVHDLYISLDYGEHGLTTCPHIRYKLEVCVIDENGGVLRDASVDFGDTYQKTNENGKVQTYFANGNYRVYVSAHGYDSVEEDVTIHDSSKILNIKMTKSAGNSEEQDFGNNIRVSLAPYSTMAISPDGDLYRFGYMSLDRNNPSIGYSSNVPQKVMSNIKSAVILDQTACAAITEAGDLYTWGRTYGASKTKPILENVESVYMENDAVAAITDIGDLYMWGWAAGGYRLGTYHPWDVDVPTLVLCNVKSVCLTGWTTAAIKRNGDLYIWGEEYNSYGYTKHIKRPEKILENVKQVDMGYSGRVAVTYSGELYMWGKYYDDSTTIQLFSATPKKVLSGVKSAYVISNGCMVIMENGDLYRYGFDCVAGTINNPEFILSNVKSAYASGSYGHALKENGDLYLWGSISGGDFVGSYNVEVPTKVLENVEQINVSTFHSGAVTKNGDVYLWGSNYYGQLGIGTFRNSKSVPTKVIFPVEENVTMPVLYSKSSVLDKQNSESTFTDLLPDTVYNFYIMSSKDAAKPFESSNLYYIDQGRTDENGNITFSYAPESKFTAAQKFVTAYENRLPDSLYDNLFITSDRANIYLHINENAMIGSGYENIRVKFEIDGVSETVTESIISEDTNVFAYSLQGKKSGKYTVNIRLLADRENELYLSKNIIERITVSVTDWHIKSKTVDSTELSTNGGFAGRQGKLIGEEVSQSEGRIVIGLTEEQLEKIGNKLVIIGGDYGMETTVETDCAYTYMYNGNTKIEAKNFKLGEKPLAAFVIIDADEDGNTISGYGYYRVYNDSAESEEYFMFDVLMLPKVN